MPGPTNLWSQVRIPSTTIYAFFSCSQLLYYTCNCTIKKDENKQKEAGFGEVVVGQLVERALPTPEVRGWNPVIGKIYIYYQQYWKDENKEKEAGNGPIFIKKTR